MKHRIFGSKTPVPQGASVLIGVPARNQVETLFAFDLAALASYTAASLLGPGQPVDAMAFFTIEGTYLCDQRREIAQRAIDTKATHILWLDSDMRFPRNALAQLLARNKDIVGANYCQRRIPCGTVAFKGLFTEQATVVYTYPWSTGLEQVDMLGFGCLLTRTEVFLKVREPWFPILWGKDVNGKWSVNGEDTGFFAWAQEAGIPCWLDHDLSHDIRHIGTWEFTHSNALQPGNMARIAAEGRYLVPPTPEPPLPPSKIEIVK